MANKHPALENIDDMMRILRANGFKGDVYEMKAPVVFADMVVKEMNDLGIELGGIPVEGDVIRLQFPSGNKVEIEVHQHGC